MVEPRQSPLETAAILIAVSALSVLVALGATRGLWVSNLHNGVFAVTFGLVGALLLSRRPGHRVAWLFVVNGLLSAVIFWGRQVGLSSTGTESAWAGWIGVWPTALAIAMTTLLVLWFPEGHFVSRGWRQVGIAVIAWSAALAIVSALWPVEYASAGVTTPFPFTLPGGDAAESAWGALAHPTYAVLQLLWLAVLVARWRSSDSVVRRQLVVLLVVVAGILVVLFTGLLVARTATPGLLSVGILPLVAGVLLNRMSLAHVVEVERAAGRLEELTPRENEVLDLMAGGLSNAAIAERLHLSIKTVEPAISAIFRKLGLHDDPASNRRVLAVAEYWSRQRS